MIWQGPPSTAGPSAAGIEGAPQIFKATAFFLESAEIVLVGQRSTRDPVDSAHKRPCNGMSCPSIFTSNM